MMTERKTRHLFPQILIVALLLPLLLSGCGGRGLDSDPEMTARQQARYPVDGVDTINLRTRPRSSPVKVGDNVPVLVLADQAGNAVSTREVTAGRDVVFVFFPGHDDPQARAVYDWVLRNRQQMANRQIEILLVTAMDEPQRNSFVAEQHQLRVGVLHDPSGWGARTFGVLDTRMSTNVSQTWSVVVGKGGNVLESRPGLYDFSEVLTLTTMRPAPQGSMRVFDYLME